MTMWRIVAVIAGGSAPFILQIATASRAPASTPHCRCSMSYMLRTRDSSTTYVLGRGTPDTVLAGSGSVRAVSPQQPVFGLIVRADSIEGAGAEGIRRALRATHSADVVIVPWHYAPSCATDYWRQSTRFKTPDSSAVFFLQVRPESTWIGGRPTFDAILAALKTYTAPPGYSGPDTRLPNDSADGLPILSAREYFALLMALPTSAEAGDSTARARLRRWVEANPTIRHRYPGNFVLSWWSRVLK